MPLSSDTIASSWRQMISVSISNNAITSTVVSAIPQKGLHGRIWASAGLRPFLFDGTRKEERRRPPERWRQSKRIEDPVENRVQRLPLSSFCKANLFQ
ncbi:MAG: hypothetical protein WBW35_09985 [Xanthobacteraceae bacterium]